MIDYYTGNGFNQANRLERKEMKRLGSLAVCCMIVVGVLANAAITSAEGPASEPTTMESELPIMEVNVTTPGSVVTAEGSVFYDPSLLESLGPEPGVAQAEVGCVANQICVYSGINYTNPYVLIACGYAGNVQLGSAGKSARNRCGNKTNYLRVNGTAIACMNPGGNRPNPGGFNQVYVLVQYGAFC